MTTLFGYLTFGQKFYTDKDTLRSEYDHPGNFIKIQYHAYDLGYYKENSLNMDTYYLDFFEETDLVKIKEE